MFICGCQQAVCFQKIFDVLVQVANIGLETKYLGVCSLVKSLKLRKLVFMQIILVLQVFRNEGLDVEFSISFIARIVGDLQVKYGLVLGNLSILDKFCLLHESLMLLLNLVF